MSRKHQMLERGDGSGGNNSKAVWDTGSSLYDSYELAAVRRLLDKRLAMAGLLPLSDEPPHAAERRDKNKQVVRARRGRKVTLRALFRAVASWAVRPRQARACACVGMAHGQSGAVEPAVSPHGKLVDQC
ncbi:uncharacterized protein LOC133909982 [Phragmites australis]|uniref:uncharacterized protein LOC133909982 n=1 Tax=Phragmites australis TaxID=29695 RepID=UPI002D79C7CE|nr:uncharacterized protein LOC133909982 [Phragmites australis]